jgi:hypothetical protein
MLPEGLAGWVAFWVLFGWVDWRLSKRGLSQSAVWRRTVRTETPSGKVATGALLTAGAYILHRHFTKTAA